VCFVPEIKIELTKNPKEKVKDVSQMAFGKVYTDHMFMMDYSDGQGWHDPRIVPYGPLSLDPASMVLHYAQEIFEGLKAYKTSDGRALLFRPEENFRRMNKSCERMAIPPIDEAFAMEALLKLVDLDRDWIPEGEGASLYLRPFIFATQVNIGVKISNAYTFMIIMTPVGLYFTEGLQPTKITVETEYVRAVQGGTGDVKTGGNYAASLKSQGVANDAGYSQVLWLDGVHRKYIEEVGAMNIFFVIGDEVVTPILNGSILDGITRKSIIELLRHEGYKVSEKRISIDELYEANQNGSLREVFGTGTAAVITPIGALKWDNKEMIVNDNRLGEISEHCYNTLYGIQTGELEDPFGWTIEV